MNEKFDPNSKARLENFQMSFIMRVRAGGSKITGSNLLGSKADIKTLLAP